MSTSISLSRNTGSKKEEIEKGPSLFEGLRKREYAGIVCSF